MAELKNQLEQSQTLHLEHMQVCCSLISSLDTLLCNCLYIFLCLYFEISFVIQSFRRYFAVRIPLSMFLQLVVFLSLFVGLLWCFSSLMFLFVNPILSMLEFVYIQFCGPHTKCLELPLALFN